MLCEIGVVLQSVLLGKVSKNDSKYNSSPFYRHSVATSYANFVIFCYSLYQAIHVTIIFLHCRQRGILFLQIFLLELMLSEQLFFSDSETQKTISTAKIQVRFPFGFAWVIFLVRNIFLGPLPSESKAKFQFCKKKKTYLISHDWIFILLVYENSNSFLEKRNVLW